jgi:hypothetical protein
MNFLRRMIDPSPWISEPYHSDGCTGTMARAGADVRCGTAPSARPPGDEGGGTGGLLRPTKPPTPPSWLPSNWCACYSPCTAHQLLIRPSPQTNFLRETEPRAARPRIIRGTNYGAHVARRPASAAPARTRPPVILARYQRGGPAKEKPRPPKARARGSACWGGTGVRGRYPIKWRRPPGVP